MMRILFVCHGNICRSTMAEFVMKELVRRHHFEEAYEIASAATSREEIGNDTHWGTREQLDLHHIPYAPRKARQMTRGDYEHYDLLIGFDDENLREIRRIAGGGPGPEDPPAAGFHRSSPGNRRPLVYGGFCQHLPGCGGRVQEPAAQAAGLPTVSCQRSSAKG